MNMKQISVIFMALAMFGTSVFAITGATTGTPVQMTRWTASTATSLATEGGNITFVNVSSSSLTDKWASFYGNVTGSVLLRDQVRTAAVYSWTWTPTSGGEVCLSENSNFPWTSSVATAKSNVDTVWAFTGTSADSAANTYTDGSCSVTLHEASPITTTGAQLSNGGVTGSSTFQNCALSSAAAPSLKTQFAFCAKMNSAGKNYKGDNVNYEVMVPTTEGSGTEPYYFYVELG